MELWIGGTGVPPVPAGHPAPRNGWRAGSNHRVQIQNEQGDEGGHAHENPRPGSARGKASDDDKGWQNERGSQRRLPTEGRKPAVDEEITAHVEEAEQPYDLGKENRLHGELRDALCGAQRRRRP